MRIFISYARPDRPHVEHLARRLGMLGHEVWLDASVRAGQLWWNEILRRIRECDAVLLALSPQFLESQACRYERMYADALEKRLLPVMVVRMPHSVLPADLAGRHSVDYAERSEEAAFALAAGIQALPAAGPLPDPLPAAPPVPLSYLNGIRDLIERPALNHQEQAGIVEQLVRGSRSADGEERVAAFELLSRLGQRPDLYDVPAQRIRAAVAVGVPSQAPMAAVAGPPPEPAPAWPQPAPAAPSTGAGRVLLWIAVAFVVLVVIGAMFDGCTVAGYPGY